MPDRSDTSRGSAGAPGLLALCIVLNGCGSTPPEPVEPPRPPPEPVEVVEAPPEEPRLPTLVRRDDEPQAPGAPVLQQVQHGPPRSVALSGDGRLMVQMGYRGAVSVVDLATGRIRFEDHPFVMGGRDRGYVRIDRSGTLVLAVGTSRVPRPSFVLHDLHTGRRIEAPDGDWQELAALHPGGTHIAWLEHDDEGTRMRIAPLPDLRGGADVRIAAGEDDPEWLNLSYSPDGSKLLLYTWDRAEIRDGVRGESLWEATVAEQEAEEDADYVEGEIEQAFFTEDGEHVVVAQSDSLVRWLAAGDGTEAHRWSFGPEGEEHIVSLGEAWFTPDARRLITFREESWTVVDGTTGETVTRIAEDEVPEEFREARLTPDGSQVVFFGYEGLLRVNADSGERLGEPTLTDFDVMGVELVGQSQAVVFGDESWTRMSLDGGAEPEVHTYAAGPFSVWRPVFRADSKGLGLLGRRTSAFLTADPDTPFEVDPCVDQASFNTWPSGAVPPSPDARCRRGGEAAGEVEGELIGRDRERRIILMKRARRLFLVDVESGTDRVRLAAPANMLTGCTGSCRFEITAALDDSRVMLSRYDGTHQRVWAFGLDNGRLQTTLSHEGGRYERPVYSANGNAVFFRGRSGLIGYDLTSRRPRTVVGPLRDYGRVILHPTREVLAIQIGNNLHVYDLANGREALDRDIGDASFGLSPDGTQVILSTEGRSEVIEWSGGAVVRQGAVAAGEQVTEEGSWVTSCVEGRMQVRRLEQSAAEARAVGPCLYGGPTAVSPDGRLLAVAESPAVRVYALDGSRWARVRVVAGAGGDAFLIEGGDGSFQVSGDLPGSVLYRPEGRIPGAVLAAPEASGHSSPDLLRQLLQ